MLNKTEKEIHTMKMTLNACDFIDLFKQYDREEDFSATGRAALFDYLEEIDPDRDVDIIGLCCEYTEYSDLAEFHSEYGKEYETLDSIADRTTLIQGYDGDKFIISNY